MATLRVEDETAQSTDPSSNPHLEAIFEDIHSRQKWNQRREKIKKRRLGDRRTKTYPYKNAPNLVEPILDDIITAKTDQESSIIENAPRYAHAIALKPGVDARAIQMAELGFDTYLRHIIGFRPKVEEATDRKNEIGMSIYKVFNKEYDDWGFLPDFDHWEEVDCVVPVNTKGLPTTSERVTFIIRLSARELREKRKQGWRNIGELIQAVHPKGDRNEEGEENEQTTLQVTDHLIGITTSGKNISKIVVYEYYHYATAWDVAHDKTGEVQKGKKCVTYFSPDMPHKPLHVMAWKKPDTVQEISQRENIELNIKTLQGGPPSPATTDDSGQAFIVTRGLDRAWPIVQSRYDYRDRHFYGARGIGHRSEDDQIAATAIKNTKMTHLDYAGSPMLQRDLNSPDANPASMQIKPGGELAPGRKFASPPELSRSFDLDLDGFKRSAAKRAGTGQFFNFSEQVSQSRQVEKTATEIESSDAQSNLVSSASVDRFMDPFRELFRQLWEGLTELRPKLPMIDQNNFEGFVDESIYDLHIMFIPAASSKTLNPTRQFQIIRGAIDWVAQYATQGLVTADFQDSITQALAYLDPQLANVLLFSPKEQGPGQQPPVYKILEQLQQVLQALTQKVQEQDQEIEVGLKAIDENAQNIEQNEQSIEKLEQDAKNAAPLNRAF